LSYASLIAPLIIFRHNIITFMSHIAAEISVSALFSCFIFF